MRPSRHLRPAVDAATCLVAAASCLLSGATLAVAALGLPGLEPGGVPSRQHVRVDRTPAHAGVPGEPGRVLRLSLPPHGTHAS